jgi:hypothetical protein
MSNNCDTQWANGREENSTNWVNRNCNLDYWNNNDPESITWTTVDGSSWLSVDGSDWILEGIPDGS